MKKTAHIATGLLSVVLCTLSACQLLNLPPSGKDDEKGFQILNKSEILKALPSQLVDRQPTRHAPCVPCSNLIKGSYYLSSYMTRQLSLERPSLIIGRQSSMIFASDYQDDDRTRAEQASTWILDIKKLEIVKLLDGPSLTGELYREVVDY